MFIRIGKVAHDPKPVVVVIRLKLLNQCDLFSAKSFKLRRNPSIERLWRVANWKLQTLIDRPAARFGKCADKIVQRDNKVLYDFMIMTARSSSGSVRG
jgi:hypothetical protein